MSGLEIQIFEVKRWYLKPGEPAKGGRGQSTQSFAATWQVGADGEQDVSSLQGGKC